MSLSSGYTDSGDLNGDGILDLAIPIFVDPLTNSSGYISVLFGRPNGTFSDYIKVPVTPYSVTPISAFTQVFIGRFFSTARVDLITDSGSIYRGNGDGTWGPESRWAGADHITIGNLFNTGFDDVVGFARNGISPSPVAIYRCNGNGTFTQTQLTSAGLDAFSCCIGDFNRDGLPDFAILNVTSKTISIFQQNSSGLFTNTRTYGLPNQDNGPKIIKCFDLRRNGILDLVIVNSSPDPADGITKIGVLLGFGDGSFQPVVNYNLAGSGAGDVCFGDFNRDGKIDMAVSCGLRVGPGQNNILQGNGFDILLGNGDGTFGPATHYSADTIVPFYSYDGVTQIGTAIALPSHNWFYITTGDFNGDGTLDLAVCLGMSGLQPNKDGSVNAYTLYQADSWIGTPIGTFNFLGQYGGTFIPAQPPPYIPTGVTITKSALTILSNRQKTKTNPFSAMANNRLSFVQTIVGPENRQRKLSNRLNLRQTVTPDVKIRNVKVSNFLQHSQVSGRLFIRNLYQIYFPYQKPVAHYTGDASLKTQVLMFRQTVTGFAAKPASNNLNFTQSVVISRIENQSVRNQLVLVQGADAFTPNAFNACKVEFEVFPPLPGV